MSNNTASKVPDNLISFPMDVLSSCDVPDTNSGKTESQGEETLSPPNKSPSPSGKIPASEVPYEVKDQPILPAQLQKDLVNLSPNQLAKAYLSEYGSYNSRKSSLKKQGRTMAPEFSDFRGFLGHVGENPYPGHYTLHRTDNENPNYGPGLVKWASKKEQNNAKGDTIRLTIDGVTKPLTQLIEESGGKENTIRSRWRKRKEKGYTDYEIVYGRKNPPKQSTADSETDCNQPSDEPLQESSPSVVANKQAEFDEYDCLYPREDRLVNIYKTSMKEYYGEIIITVPKKDVAMLTKIADAIRDAGYLEETVLLFIFRFWPQFASHACKKNGWWSEPPEVPAFGFLTKAANRILGFVESRGKGDLGPILAMELERKRLAKEQEQMVEEQQRLKKLNKEQWKFVLKFLKSTPEYKNLKARSKAHRKLKSSMDKSEWKRTNTDLGYEMAQLKQAQGLFQVALKAWKRKQNK